MTKTSKMDGGAELAAVAVPLAVVSSLADRSWNCTAPSSSREATLKGSADPEKLSHVLHSTVILRRIAGQENVQRRPLVHHQVKHATCKLGCP
ncbi:hypothetical protein PoMZ_03269 [Pyricularia oryzae]|uniref:Uncharacterized protein n=1 Tax=Pyricularia oryzae TaxID=318829 RepID=A0A4P7N784_PYROR|nr:hypothetical protein PoMZ_03269 [Pyricularia oryzae]